MKKWLLGALLPMMGIMTLSAQEIITGKVTDKHGAPIPGARVETKGGTETTLTELDGTFRLETKSGTKRVKVDYVGMQSRTQRKSANMEFVLSKTNLWNREPLRQQWFLALEAGFPDASSMQPSFGLMAGRARNFGWYVKGLYRPVHKADLTAAEYGFTSSERFGSIPEEYWWTTGKTRKGFSSVTAGGIVRLKCALHVYAGIGYAWRNVHHEISGGKYIDSESTYSNIAVDYGLMLRLGRVLLNGGTVMSFDDGAIFIGNVGVGICF